MVSDTDWNLQKQRMKTLTLTLDHETEKTLREIAAAQGGRSVSSLIREAVAAHLATITPQASAADQDDTDTAEA